VHTKVKDATFGKEYGLTLFDYSGKAVHLFDYRRKVLIAYAWASWCPYCGAELQNLAELKKTYGESIAIVAINRSEPLAVAKAFTDHLQNTDGLVFLTDPSDAFFKEIGGYAMPETVFIDVGGAVTFHQRGPIQISGVDEKIKELLR
jgi:thiol-disulfide isomerase/thioredoxin